MAGSPEPIVIDPAKPALERAEATQIRAKMLEETIGGVGKNIMDAVTKYDEAKTQKQKQDLASITMAGTLSGGMDKLPQETKNKIPGILGVPLPTDDQGNVQITPDLDTLIKRGTIQMMQDDPDILRVLAGIQEKKADPFKMATDIKLGDMKLAGDREKIAADAAKSAAENDAKIQASIISGQYKVAAADVSGKAKTDAASIRANAAAKQKTDLLPSPYILDPKTNTLMTEPQWYSTYPNQQMPPKLSNADAKLISNQQMHAASIAASNASAEANRVRVETAQFNLKNLMSNPDPNNLAGKQVRTLVDAYRLSKGTDNEAAMKDFVNKQMPNIFKQQGFKDEDIAALTAAAGEGGWADWALNNFNSAMGNTSVGSSPSLLQPLTATIPGVTPTIANVITAPIRSALEGGKGSASAAPKSNVGKTLTTDEFKKLYPNQ